MNKLDRLYMQRVKQLIYEVKSGKKKIKALKNRKQKLKFGRIDRVRKIGKGACATCFHSKDLVVLYSLAYSENELNWLVKKTNEIKEQGVRIVPIVHYYDTKSFVKGYRCFVVIQPFCEGEWLYKQIKPADTYKNLQDEKQQKVVNAIFERHLKESYRILKMKDDVIKKFINDYIQIENSGIRVDCYNAENFIINKDGINFIDLSKNNTATIPSNEEIAKRITNLLVGIDYQYRFNYQFPSSKTEEMNKAKKAIVDKVFAIFDSMGIEHPTKKEYNKKVIIYPKFKPINNE